LHGIDVEHEEKKRQIVAFLAFLWNATFISAGMIDFMASCE